MIRNIPAPSVSGGATFDLYVSPTGDDNNAGTLGSPWSITAFINNTPSAYQGKRIGLLPGTYTLGTKGGVQTSLFTLCTNTGNSQGGAQACVAISIGGGTAGSPTYVGSSDSTGYYSARTATLDASNPSGGAAPTVNCGLIGQSYLTNSSGQTMGYMVLDGIIVTKSYGAGVNHFPAASTGAIHPGGPTGLVLKNSEIHHIHGNGPGNFGAYFSYACVGTVVQNCKIHDNVPDGAYTAEDSVGISTQECLNNIYEYNTIYNCNSGIYDKNTSQGATIRYNYIDNTVNPNACIFDTSSGVAGSTVHEYNNILVAHGGGIWGASATFFPAHQSWVVYNNSFYQPNGTWGGYAGAFLPCDPAQSASITFYNNIVATASGSSNMPYDVCTGSITLSDYNCYQDGTTTPLNQSPTSSPYSNTGYTLANWQSTFSKDLGSITQASGTMFSAYQSLTASSFKTIPAAVQTLGHVGGVSGGAVINAGAWGGTDVSLFNGQAITQIGCNF